LRARNISKKNHFVIIYYLWIWSSTYQRNMGNEQTASCCETSRSHSDDHSHGTGRSSAKLFLPAIISLFLLLLGLAFDNAWLPRPPFFEGWLRFAWYGAAYLPVGGPVIREMFQAIAKTELFSEFTLMT